MEIETRLGKFNFAVEEEAFGFYIAFWITDHLNEINKELQIDDYLNKKIVKPLKKIDKTSTFPDLPYSESWASCGYRIFLRGKHNNYIAFSNPIFLRGLRKAQNTFKLNFSFKVWSTDGQPRIVIWPSEDYYPLIRSN